jgi:Tfp pilus assembly protein PilO
MKATDKTLLMILPAVALVIGFYLLVISPKQKQIGDLDDQISTLTTRVDAAESQVAAAEDARKSFGANYSEIVSLGSAVPEDSDQATLIFDMTKTSQEAGVNFRSFELADSGDVTAGATASTTTTTQTDSTTPATGSGESSSTTTTSAPTSVTPTEADAASLPIGSTVGPAGLPVMPYKLKFNGSFFDMADFFGDLDKGVEVSGTKVDPKVNGRLMTINGFAMVGDPIHGFPHVQTSVALNTYLVPADQGLSAGATPAGPTTTDSTSTVTSASTTDSGVPGTAAVTP